ncbi:head GIN domain-containing protein [Saccharicrinis sp. FJH54]|uniref:head GIN domain-containing protein n=1 Tax=Saccharicrinis sp. FJH54 TaxID=3344665 RepID=UPI0035D4754B
MKKLLSLLFLMTIVSGLSAQVDSIREETRNLDPFNRVIAAHGINVKLIYNDLEEAHVKVKGAPLEDVITEVEDMTLKVRMKAKLLQDVTVMVDVSYKQVKYIEANTGAYIETVRPLWGEKVKLYAITGGVIKAESTVSEVEAVTSGASTIEIYGKAKQFDANANLGGKVDAFALKTGNVKVKSNSGSTINVYSSDSIQAKASVGGIINIKGDPSEKDFKTSLGGEIKEIKPNPAFGKDLIKDENDK